MTTQAAPSPPTIGQRVEQMHQAMAGQMPEQVIAAISGEQADLGASGLPTAISEVGESVPEASLLDINGVPITLSRALNGRTAVVVLYRGGWCPYCSLTLQAYQEVLLPQLHARGVPLLAISPQKAEASLDTLQSKALTFTLLSDPGNTVARALGVQTAPTEEVRDAQKLLGTDLPALNADGSYEIPMPTVAIVDADRTIRWIDVHPNYATRTEADAILAALDTLTPAN